MRRRVFLHQAGLFAMAALLPGCVFAQVEPARPQRDPDLAVQEEFAMAEAGNTAEGWKLFIARHPGHPLSAEARRRLAALKR